MIPDIVIAVSVFSVGLLAIVSLTKLDVGSAAGTGSSLMSGCGSSTDSGFPGGIVPLFERVRWAMGFVGGGVVMVNGEWRGERFDTLVH